MASVEDTSLPHGITYVQPSIYVGDGMIFVHSGLLILDDKAYLIPRGSPVADDPSIRKGHQDLISEYNGKFLFKIEEAITSVVTARTVEDLYSIIKLDRSVDGKPVAYEQMAMPDGTYKMHFANAKLPASHYDMIMSYVIELCESLKQSPLLDEEIVMTYSSILSIMTDEERFMNLIQYFPSIGEARREAEIRIASTLATSALRDAGAASASTIRSLPFRAKHVGSDTDPAPLASTSAPSVSYTHRRWMEQTTTKGISMNGAFSSVRDASSQEPSTFRGKVATASGTGLDLIDDELFSTSSISREGMPDRLITDINPDIGYPAPSPMAISTPKPPTPIISTDGTMTYSSREIPSHSGAKYIAGGAVYTRI